MERHIDDLNNETNTTEEWTVECASHWDFEGAFYFAGTIVTTIGKFCSI